MFMKSALRDLELSLEQAIQCIVDTEAMKHAELATVYLAHARQFLRELAEDDESWRPEHLEHVRALLIDVARDLDP